MKQSDITEKLNPQPKQIRLDSTTSCNARCLSCHKFLSKRKGEMDLGFLDTILDDVSRWKTPLNEIVPVNYGEFFMRKDWRVILKSIESKLPDTMIVIPTNGGRLKPKDIDDLCRVRTLKIVNFSINAFYEDTYEAFTGLKKDNIDNIRNSIMTIRVQRPDILVVASLVFDPMYQTDNERDSFYYYWKQFCHVEIIAAASARRPDKKTCGTVGLPCRSIFSDVVIGYDGKLSTCCFDADFHLDLGSWSGNILKDWQNDKLTELRKLHNENKRDSIDLCRLCTSA